jgi:1,4-alpha-glucan branching enzyme
MKGSMLNKMHGSRAQKFANLRALYAYMWAHPGKKLLFMGGELGQWREWSEERSLDWHLLDEPEHEGVRTLVRDLNKLLVERPALSEADVEPRGFRWIDVDNALENVVAFLRTGPYTGDRLVCVCNFSAVAREGYRVGLPAAGGYRLILNTDAPVYAGAGERAGASFEAEEQPWQGFAFSAALDLPPLTVLWFHAPPAEVSEEDAATARAHGLHAAPTNSKKPRRGATGKTTKARGGDGAKAAGAAKKPSKKSPAESKKSPATSSKTSTKRAPRHKPKED